MPPLTRSARRTWVLGVALALVSGLPGVGAGQAPPPDSARAAAVRAALAAMGPGPEHHRLVALEGAWRAAARYANGPGHLELQGSATVRPVLGGRFVVLETRLPSPELPIEGLVVLGFDRRASQYTYLGFDTFGTYYVGAAGAWDEEAQVLRMPGTSSDPRTGEVKSYEMNFRFPAPDTFVAEIVFQGPDGRRWVAVETTYTRTSG